MMYVIIVIVVWALLSWFFDMYRAQRIRTIKADYNKLTADFRREYDTKFHALESERAAFRDLEFARAALDAMFKEKSCGFPWLATAYADLFKLREMRIAEELESKERPVPKAAEAVRESSHRRFIAEKLWRILKYKLEYYETLFPWLVDFEGEELDELIRQVLDGAKQERTAADDGSIDPASKFLAQAEYENLSTAERNQLALDRYRAGRKSKWQIGRDYERYIGYFFENEGWDVIYHGIIEGVADAGRDLIASKNSQTLIIQCKRWSAEKQIHEKHISQLFGTVEEYKFDKKLTDVQGLLVTTTQLSERAKRFADHLGIEYWESCPMAEYPVIKCNVSHRDGSKIYHLPFDQQYDRTTIDEDRKERYVSTVAEAEALGFRRAWRWKGTAEHREAQGALFTSA